MKLGIFSIALGALSACMYIVISLMTVVVRFDKNGWAYGTRDWLLALPFVIVGLSLIVLGIFRLRGKKVLCGKGKIET